jgi:uncharacterized protein (TIGR03000 family)
MRLLAAIIALAISAPVFGQDPLWSTPRPYTQFPQALNSAMNSPGIYPALAAFILSGRSYRDFRLEWDYGIYFPREEELAPPPSVPARLDPWFDPSRARVTLTVPVNAEVWIEDTKSKSAGTKREFLSPKLEEGRTYKYKILVRWVEGNTKLERRFEVPVRAGASPTLLVMGGPSGK